mmetsp:Transcript_38694/g.77948  ORF Transcript_38694/g.77948 Transcript_38694/m.77948 type:complete len:247 (+) Transcript_38694:193-933(+)
MTSSSLRRSWEAQRKADPFRRTAARTTSRSARISSETFCKALALWPTAARATSWSACSASEAQVTAVPFCRTAARTTERSPFSSSLANCNASPSRATAAKTTSLSACNSRVAKRSERPSSPTSASQFTRCGWHRSAETSRTLPSAREAKASESSSSRAPTRSRCSPRGMPMAASSAALASATVHPRCAGIVWEVPAPDHRTRSSRLSAAGRLPSAGSASTRTAWTEQKSCHPERMTTRRNSTCQGA